MVKDILTKVFSIASRTFSLMQSRFSYQQARFLVKASDEMRASGSLDDATILHGSELGLRQSFIDEMSTQIPSRWDSLLHNTGIGKSLHIPRFT